MQRVADNAHARTCARHLSGCAFRQAEVEQNDLAVRSQFQIRWLDVAVNNGRLVCVQVFERVQQIISPAQDFLRREWLRASFEEFAQITSRNELHDEKLP